MRLSRLSSAVCRMTADETGRGTTCVRSDGRLHSTFRDIRRAVCVLEVDICFARIPIPDSLPGHLFFFSFFLLLAFWFFAPPPSDTSVFIMGDGYAHQGFQMQ